MYYIFKNIKHDIPFVFLLILCFYVLAPFGVMSLSLILFALFSIVCNVKSIKTNVTTHSVKGFLIQTSFFLFMALSIFYSPDKVEGLKELQTGLPLIVIPLCFFFFTKKISKSKLKKVLITFVIAKLLYIIYIYSYFTYRVGISKQFNISEKSYLERLLFTIKLPFKSVINNAINVATDPPKIFFHKAYLSMSLLFAICIVAYYFIIKNKKINKQSILGVFLITLFSLVLFHWFSVTNLGLYFLISYMLLMSFFKKIKHKILVSCALIVFSFGIYNIPSIKTAIKNNKSITKNGEELLSFVNSPFSKENKTNRMGARSAINECNIELTKSNLLFGHGIGALKTALKQCYIDKKFKLGVLYNLNSHNYYFHIILSSGLLGLLLFIFMVYNNFKIAVYQSDFLYISFLIIICMNLITENIIFRAHGVLFFSLFNALFYKFNTDKSNFK